MFSLNRLALPLMALALGLAILAGALAWGLGGGTAPAAIGGPFRLVNQDGKTVTDADFRGEPLLVFFGYTHCPDDCPITLAEMTMALKKLGPQAAIRGAFITVDPERDTPAVMKNYLTSFDPRIAGLTGARPAIDAVLKEYRVFFKKVPGKNGDYTSNHSTVVYLMDKQGRFVNAVDFSRGPAAADKQLKAYM